MPADLWGTILTGCLIVLLGALLLEPLLVPRPRLGIRPISAWLLHIGVCLLSFVLELILFRRAYFGAAMALSTLLLLIVVSNIKRVSLREPYVFQDYEYFIDVIKHPRLYLPFFGIGKLLAGISAFIAALIFGMEMEPDLPTRFGWEGYVLALLSLIGLGMAAIKLGLASRRPALSFNPEQDLQQLGFLAYQMEYWQAQKQPIATHNSPFASLSRSRPLTELPDLIVVQSESFFDPRRLCPNLASPLFEGYDRILAESVCHGLLNVPAWGANTARTEFAFLTGLSPEALGVHRFNPFRSVYRTKIDTIAHSLSRIGYRVLCIHPYGKSFYGRDEVYPRFGFDAFIDIANFCEADRSGPYVGDLAVADQIKLQLRETPENQPVFIFVITMENHGPLHWEIPSEWEREKFYREVPAAEYNDLTIYLRHLEHAYGMMDSLIDTLKNRSRDGWLCWYGDHVPIMDQVYRLAGFPDGKTDYFLWHKAEQNQAEVSEFSVQDLALLLLSKISL